MINTLLSELFCLAQIHPCLIPCNRESFYFIKTVLLTCVVFCLQGLVEGRVIECPSCHEDTEVPVGLEVRHLKKRVVRTVPLPGEPPGERVEKEVGVEGCWAVPGEVVGAAVGVEGRVYLGVATKDGPLRLYDHGGGLVRVIDVGPGGEALVRPRLALDPSRGVLTVLSTRKTAPYIASYDRELRPLTSIRPPQLQSPTGISHHPTLDLYIIPDRGARALLLITPQGTLHRKLDALGDGELLQGVAVGCDVTGVHTHWATSDWGAGGVIRVFTRRGEGVGVYGGHFRYPYGVTLDKEGGVIVCDSHNHRLVRLPLSAINLPLDDVTNNDDVIANGDVTATSDVIKPDIPVTGVQSKDGNQAQDGKRTNKTKTTKTQDKTGNKKPAVVKKKPGSEKKPPPVNSSSKKGKTPAKTPAKIQTPASKEPSMTVPSKDKPTTQESKISDWETVLCTRQFHLGGPRLVCVTEDNQILLVLRHSEGPSYILLLDNVL